MECHLKLSCSTRGFCSAHVSDGGNCRNSEFILMEYYVTYNSDVQIGVLVVLGVEASLQEQQVYLHGMSPIIQMFK